MWPNCTHFFLQVSWLNCHEFPRTVVAKHKELATAIPVLDCPQWQGTVKDFGKDK